jgi:hypothetical protein
VADTERELQPVGRNPPDIEAELEDGQEPRFPDEVRGLSRAEIFSKDAQLERASELLREE